MMDALSAFTMTHPTALIAGVTGAIIVAAAAVVRAYGRRHEQATRRRGDELIG